MVQALDECLRKESQRGEKERSRTARRITNLESKNLLRCSRYVADISEFPQCPARDRPSELRACVKGASTLARIAFSDQIPFAGEDCTRYEPLGRLIQFSLIFGQSFGLGVL